jgi:hypothetical protein
MIRLVSSCNGKSSSENARSFGDASAIPESAVEVQSGDIGCLRRGPKHRTDQTADAASANGGRHGAEKNKIIAAGFLRILLIQWHLRPPLRGRGDRRSGRKMAQGVSPLRHSALICNFCGAPFDLPPFDLPPFDLPPLDLPRRRPLKAYCLVIVNPVTIPSVLCANRMP